MEIKNFIREYAKPSLFMFFLLFLSGRIGLLLHEFAGHALSWRLLGGRVTGFKLFLFGGGMVQYGGTPKTDHLSYLSFICVQLSGIGTELIAGSIFAVLAIFLRTNRLERALFSVAASVLLVHGLFYLVTCTYYGYADGRILFDIFRGNARYAFLLATSCLTVGAAFFVSFNFSPLVKSWAVDSHTKKRAFPMILSVAVLLHGALTVSEQILAKDRGYSEIKTSVNDRLKQEELSEFMGKYVEEHGKEAEQEVVNAFADELEIKYRQFPITAPLGFAVLVAFLAGFVLSENRKYSETNLIKWKDNWILGSVSAFTVVLIVALNLM